MNLHETLLDRKYLHAILSPVLFIFVSACSPTATSEPPKTSTLDSTLQVPDSELSVPIFYPLADLEALVNGKLEKKIIEAKIAIDQGAADVQLQKGLFEKKKKKPA